MIPVLYGRKYSLKLYRKGKCLAWPIFCTSLCDNIVRIRVGSFLVVKALAFTSRLLMSIISRVLVNEKKTCVRIDEG